MENLHIPLHSHHAQTTRRTRRVVWQQAIPLVVLLLIAASAGCLWFGRNTLEAATPDQALALLHFTPTKKGWDVLEKHFSDFPLVSGAPLTLKDIRPFTKGEFSVFILPEGKRALAVRAKKEDLPFPLFDSLGVVVKTISGNSHLLSTQPLSTQPHKTSSPWFSHLQNPLRPPLATIHIFGEDPTNGIVTASATRITIKIKTNFTQTILSPDLLPTNFAAAARLEDTLVNTTFEPKPSAISIADGVLMEFGSETQREAVERLFDRMIEQQNLRLSYKPLPDGTLAQEILLDDATSNKEQIVLKGSRLTRTVTKTGNLFLAEKAEKLAISDSQTMMEAWLTDAPFEKNLPCKKSSVIVSLDQISDHEAANSNAYENLNILRALNLACISQGLFSTNIEFFPEYNP